MNRSHFDLALTRSSIGRLKDGSHSLMHPRAETRPSGAFTSRLPTDRLSSPLLDMTTTATGLLCWRDFHPLEWQLVSLHSNRTCGFPASGSPTGFIVRHTARGAKALVRGATPRFSIDNAGGESACGPPLHLVPSREEIAHTLIDVVVDSPERRPMRPIR
jgi:hypothetical protein